MADERSTLKTWAENPDQGLYDQDYYKYLLPLCKGVVLDLGCGAGMMTRLIEADKIYAIDKFPINERLYVGDRFISSEQDITKGFTVPEKVDCVVSTEFIEHITKEDFIKLLPRIKDCLKDGGIFIGSTPNKIVPTTNPYHLYEYTLDELEEILKEHFKTVTIFDNGKYCSIWNATL